MVLARLHTERGELARASAELDEVDPEARARATFAYSRGLLSLARGDARRAHEELTESVKRYDREKPTALEVEALIALSRTQRSLGRTEEALAAAQRAVSIADSLAPKGMSSYLVGRAQAELGEVELARGDRAAARKTLAAAAETLKTTLGPDRPATLRARQVLASIPGG
jgi:tetratricopeptide (TPR) repeat protein